MAKQLHRRAGKEPPADNPWQNVDRLSRRWRESLKTDPLEGLADETIRTLRLAFTRRNVLDHNGGVIDDGYVRQAGEGVLGRKVRIKPAWVKTVFVAVESLADRLEQTGR